MATLHILKVFVGEDGAGGNPLGVFLDGGEAPENRRQEVAARLGFSETVFVDDAGLGEVRIFTPATELPFAGHPLVGAAWLLARERSEVPVLRPPAGEVPARVEGDTAFIVGRPEWAPPFEHLELGSPAAVEALPGTPEGHDLAGVWAWEDEAAGRIRCRVFAPRLGVEEDEATGAHAVRLAARLGREIVILQGAGSAISARPVADGAVEIGGRVEPVEVREYKVE
jgi:predicted PhzF superfamily epimerase YddE/YHI9